MYIYFLLFIGFFLLTISDTYPLSVFFFGLVGTSPNVMTGLKSKEGHRFGKRCTETSRRVIYLSYIKEWETESQPVNETGFLTPFSLVCGQGFTSVFFNTFIVGIL